jgi:uroporphyrinogen decarboxylase
VTSVTPRERVLAALDHREADRVPLDLGSTYVTSIHHVAYRALRNHLGLAGDVEVADIRQGLALVDEDIRDWLKVDAGIVKPQGPDPDRWRLDIRDEGEYRVFTDEFGMGWRSPSEGGLYFDQVHHPLSGDITVADVESYPWPDPQDSHRFLGMRERARQVREVEGRAVIVRGLTTGVFELSQWMRGPEQFFMDLIAEPKLAEALLDKAMELKLRYWAGVFEALGDLVDMTYDSDDYGTQQSLIISPDTWRRMIKPRLAALTKIAHDHGGKTFLHSCGAIRPLLPDLIEAGVDAINPVQVSAAGMDTHELKREFGRDIVFWGGGVDTQRTLPFGSPEDVKDEVRRRLGDLMPGGGFVFTPVHNIQADVPPQNLVAMWETVREFGTYGALGASAQRPAQRGVAAMEDLASLSGSASWR